MAVGAACVIWLRGLPCSGKSTLATLVAEQLQRGGSMVQVLDGDAIRATLSPDLGFSKEDRDANVARIAYVASLQSLERVIAKLRQLGFALPSLAHA